MCSRRASLTWNEYKWEKCRSQYPRRESISESMEVWVADKRMRLARSQAVVEIENDALGMLASCCQDRKWAVMLTEHLVKTVCNSSSQESCPWNVWLMTFQAPFACIINQSKEWKDRRVAYRALVRCDCIVDTSADKRTIGTSTGFMEFPKRNRLKFHRWRWSSIDWGALADWVLKCTREPKRLCRWSGNDGRAPEAVSQVRDSVTLLVTRSGNGLGLGQVGIGR